MTVKLVNKYKTIL